MSNTWALDVEPLVYTIIKAKTEAKLKTKYPKIYFTNSDELLGDTTKSHTVYIHELEPVEVGQDTNGNTINGLISTFEVKVIVNTNKAECRDILKAIIPAFKELCFDGKKYPSIMTVSGMQQGVARFSRIIGANDKIG